MNLVLMFFCVGVLLSPFYIFPSGLPQPSHFSLLLFCFTFFVFYIKLGSFKSNDLINGVVKYLLFFCLYILMVNVVYSLIWNEFSFLLDSVFYIFNFLIYTFVLMYFYWFGSRKYLLIVSFSILLIMFFLAALDIGRFDFGSRYNGFHNDPNQLAYWVVCILVIIAFSSKSFFINLISVAIGVYIVYETQSRSGLLGVLLILCGLLFQFKDVLFSGSVISKTVIVLLCVSIALIFTTLNFGVNSTTIREQSQYEDRLEGINVEYQAKKRGYYRPLEYPEYLIFGSGKGLENRFGSTVEIHSSWVAILFYYGFIGFLLFSVFVYKVFSLCNHYERFYLFAPFFFGISTYGLRTPIFWICLAIATALVFIRITEKGKV
ncbi:hypothetical protein [Pseudoalteromonas viridis]|uniref:O-antigen polymerase n=1 Tax=Pseudoalteromonas viridis TaxID=339617 RepID=A0ABX7V6J0_9GAMM|nr:hypothetical protein [Pseudoalteromonas viridis]QTL36070.1 hypothetical protein J5X90_03200 [Pseudoalteromonas viridis]